MSVRVAINGFGRIGRNILRSAHSDEERTGGRQLEFVAVNDLTDPETLAHLFRYDSVHGRFDGEVEVRGDSLEVNGREIRVLAEPDPGSLPWEDMGVDLVLEATGRFRNREDAAKHLQAGARKVIITAPAKKPDITLVYGVNHADYDPAEHDIISNASCTTNCVAVVVKVLQEEFGFEEGLMTTVHSYTNNQSILDTPHKDLRRARAAAMSIIPTTTGAAKATELVLPAVEGRLDGMAMRVPTPDVSLVDLVATLGEKVEVERLNDVLRSRSEGDMGRVLDYSDELLVSVDYVGHPASAIVDGASTASLGGRMVKVVAWYDNEWGYSTRCCDMAGFVGEKLAAEAVA